MAQRKPFTPKAGYVYVVTNECLKLVKAKGNFEGEVKAVKIGSAKDFTNRLGSLNTAVYENFDFHMGIKTNDVGTLENRIHDMLQVYRIYTRDGDRTEFFACPLKEVKAMIRKIILKERYINVEEYDGGKVVGRSGAAIRNNLKKPQSPKKTVKKPTEKAKPRTEPFSFKKVGIAKGEELVFDPTGIKVTVVDEKKIEYKGTTYSLSGFCKAFMPKKNDSGAYAGPKYFSYNGTKLYLLRKEKEDASR